MMKRPETIHRRNRWQRALLLAAAALTPATAVAAGAGPSIGGCPMFPPDNVWNTPIDHAPVSPHSAQYIASIGASGHVHPDFGSDPSYGLPYMVVPAAQLPVSISFDYAAESDPGPYPIPLSAPIEVGDAHALVVQRGSCVLYETWDTRLAPVGWAAGSGAVFELRSNALRPAGWTSADAAGLPILPGLVRYDEVASGTIEHALRFTVASTQAAYVWPARHFASNNSDPSLPPMGTRLRLRADYPEAGLAPGPLAVVRALKRYGMILADNGSNWYITGATDPRWNDDAMHQLTAIQGSDFRVIDESALRVSANSAEARIFGSGFER